MKNLFRQISVATYLAIALHFVRKIVRRCTVVSSPYDWTEFDEMTKDDQIEVMDFSNIEGYSSKPYTHEYALVIKNIAIARTRKDTRMLQRIASYAKMMAPTLRGEFDIMYGPMPMGIEPSPETGILVTLDVDNMEIIANKTSESEQYAIKTAVNTVASGIAPKLQKVFRPLHTKANTVDFSITPEKLKKAASKLASMDIKANSRPIAPV